MQGSMLSLSTHEDTKTPGSDRNQADPERLPPPPLSTEIQDTVSPVKLLNQALQPSSKTGYSGHTEINPSLKLLSEKLSEANFPDTQSPAAPFGHKGPSAAEQTKVHQRGGTNTHRGHQGPNEDSSADILLDLNVAAIGAKNILSSGSDFKSSSNAANKEMVNQLIQFHKLSFHGNTGQAYPSPNSPPKGVGKFSDTIGHQEAPTDESNRVRPIPDLYTNTELNDRPKKRRRLNFPGPTTSLLSTPDVNRQGTKFKGIPFPAPMYNVYLHQARKTTKGPIIGQPIESPVLTQHTPIETSQSSLRLPETPQLSLRSAFPGLAKKRIEWFEQRSEAIKPLLVELNPEIVKLGAFYDKIRKEKLIKLYGESKIFEMETVRCRLEVSFISFFEMLKRTREYLGVESLAKENEGVDSSTDSQYSWWQAAWNEVNFGEKKNKAKKFANIFPTESVVQVLEGWYTNMNFLHFTPVCAAWLVTKWMESSAPAWMEKLKNLPSSVADGDRSVIRGTMAHKLYAGLFKGKTLGGILTDIENKTAKRIARKQGEKPSGRGRPKKQRLAEANSNLGIAEGLDS
ncbi:hypothetical protein CROQUDRAFT_547016 [Cronartium quercuum f. sp. fusiforme G11]|uniref:Uncharacterized protein n=1 Tax=Cronartium quercuum f. sp. fusiforme G11 TaxID=708437 RepID=A0A9P6NKY7_9BASI|nr:hypothetical protein CROQUDRAFT_547016 [Cronartium quercuum f. sp. fusiforme G11]